MFCHNCGTKLPDGSAFCPNCGEAVYKEDGDGSVKHTATHARAASEHQGPELTSLLETAYKIQITAYIIATTVFVLLYLGLDLDLVFIWSFWVSSFTTVCVYGIVCIAIQVVGVLVARNRLKGVFPSDQELNKVLMYRELKDGETEQVKTVNAFIRKRRGVYLVISNILSALFVLAVVRHFILAAVYMG